MEVNIESMIRVLDSQVEKSRAEYLKAKDSFDHGWWGGHISGLQSAIDMIKREVEVKR